MSKADNELKQHREAIGEALPLFLWLLGGAEGYDLAYGNLISDLEIAARLKVSVRTLSRWRARLVQGGYIASIPIPGRYYRIGNMKLVSDAERLLRKLGKLQAA